MSTVHVVAKKDFLESLTVARPLVALAELVWNGFDAESERIQIHLDLNRLGGLETIRVRDYGYGINHAHVENLFGNLGDSWKRGRTRQGGRALHGSSGKGRFRAFALGTIVEWNTTFRGADGRSRSYRIRGQAMSLEDFEIQDPVDAPDAATGTEVTISNLRAEFGSLLDPGAALELGKLFAAYLTEYPGLVLEYNGTRVDPKDAQKSATDYDLGAVQLGGERAVPATLTVVEWKMSADRALHLCDATGVALHETTVGQNIRAPGFDFTAYVRSDHFRELEAQNQLILEELHSDVTALVQAARASIKEHFRQRLLENQGRIVQEWKNASIYPYDDQADSDPITRAERQLFDILAVNIVDCLPAFEDADTKSRRFMFRLLAAAVRQDPDGVQRIAGEVLGLKKEAQDEIADLLRKSPIASVLRSAQGVSARLDFLKALENLLFGRKTRSNQLEREQLHRILEREPWLFGEEFALAGSDLSLDPVLRQHLGELLGLREDAGDATAASGAASDGNPKSARTDMMLHKVAQPREGERVCLVVVLRRSTRRIDDALVAQLTQCARAVAGDARFRDGSGPSRWTFVAIADDLADLDQGDPLPAGWPKGKMADDGELKFTVWVTTWAGMVADARARLGLVNAQLALEADDETARAQLRATHAKFIPSPGAMS